MQLKRWRWLIGLFFLALLGPVNLYTADLGRHLKNGETLLNEGFKSLVLTTNYYSYTYPDFPSVNHHWLFGVFAYLVWQVLGFAGVNLMNATLITLGFLFALKVAASFTDSDNDRWLIFCAFLIWPLIVFRTEIRPESISFAWVGFYWWILTAWWQKKIKDKWLLLLLPLQLIWANSHIFFPLGIYMVAAFLLQSVLSKEKESSKILGRVIFALLLLSAINPFGWKLFFVPLTIFNNYNYLIVENQSPFFLAKLAVNLGLHLYSLLIIAFSLISIIWILSRKKINLKTNVNLISLLLMTAITLTGSLKIMRVYPYFAIFALSLFAFVGKSVEEWTKEWWRRVASGAQQLMLSVGSVLVFLAAAAILASGIFWPNSVWAGIALLPNSAAAANFYQSLNLTGRIFNNYDIGGYLIYFLPNQSVFVDNRPAEYPAPLFDLYRTAQTDKAVFAQLAQTYQIEAVFFYRHDLTPWSQEFMHQLLLSEEWVPIYVDQYTIIFISNVESHQNVIEQYRIPNEAFTYG